MTDLRDATFALQLQRATRRYMSIRFLALASTARGAISRPPIDPAGTVPLYHPAMGLAHAFKVGEALRMLAGQSRVMPVGSVA